MNSARYSWLLLAAALLFCFASIALTLEVPYLQGRITDDAELLSTSVR